MINIGICGDFPRKINKMFIDRDTKLTHDITIIEQSLAYIVEVESIGTIKYDIYSSNTKTKTTGTVCNSNKSKTFVIIDTTPEQNDEFFVLIRFIDASGRVTNSIFEFIRYSDIIQKNKKAKNDSDETSAYYFKQVSSNKLEEVIDYSTTTTTELILSSRNNGIPE